MQWECDENLNQCKYDRVFQNEDVKYLFYVIVMKDPEILDKFYASINTLTIKKQ